MTLQELLLESKYGNEQKCRVFAHESMSPPNLTISRRWALTARLQEDELNGIWKMTKLFDLSNQIRRLCRLFTLDFNVTNEPLVIDIISATRLSEEDFWKNSALGISLKRLNSTLVMSWKRSSYDCRLITHIAFENRLALPEIYNARILACAENDILVFIHDDVWIDDYFFTDRVIEGLEKYDVIGIVGNRCRALNQPHWSHLIEPNGTVKCDDPGNLSGAIVQGKSPFSDPCTFYGETPADCELLDGVFLAANKMKLLQNGVQFDPRFKFHFYDMDFCRSAKQHGLRLGTWPICLTHQSEGDFTKIWNEGYNLYIEKWGS